MQIAQCCSALLKKIAICENSDRMPLDAGHATTYCGDYTEVGAPEVDGLQIGTRFGEGQSGSRTRESPPRCIFACGDIVAAMCALSTTSHSALASTKIPPKSSLSQIAILLATYLLTKLVRRPRFPCAPRTERRRLMAPRSAPASAEVNREAGRRGHRLGAFSLLPGSPLTGDRSPA